MTCSSLSQQDKRTNELPFENPWHFSAAINEHDIAASTKMKEPQRGFYPPLVQGTSGRIERDLT